MKLRSVIVFSLIFLGTFIVEKSAYSIEKENEEIPLTEDLMREHGILNRVLLIYEEIIKRLEGDEFPRKCLAQSVAIIEEFIENYHEKLEENYLFPLFKKNKKQLTLIKTLQKQHERGRIITAQLKEIAHTSFLTCGRRTKQRTVTLLKKFITMYRPHESREDTVLFPQVRSLLNEKEFKALGEKFEDLEHELFGKEGFFSIVKKVELIEKDLGIYSLEQFTP